MGIRVASGLDSVEDGIVTRRMGNIKIAKGHTPDSIGAKTLRYD